MKQELQQLIGEKPYEVLAAHCAARAKLPREAKTTHPASDQASNL